MRSLLLGVLMFGCLTVAALKVSAAESEQSTSRPDQWRYKWHNGQWWYWLPENRWVYWQADRWNDYLSSTGSPHSTARLALRDYSTPQSFLRSAYGDPATAGFEIGPFYGHAQSQGECGIRSESEIGPFYGRAIASQDFGDSRFQDASVGPFYGHAISCGD